MDERLNNYIGSLLKMINIRTVSYKDENDKEVFDKFHNVLKELFPNVFLNFKYEEFGSSILLSYIVDNDLEPVLFMSHHDVVSENGEWVHEAFNATVEDGKIYGRGTLDTKGNLWAILQSLEELLKDGYKFNRSIYVESSCNEETTGKGAYAISRELINRGIHFYFVLDEGGMILYDPIGGASGYYAMVALGEKDCVDLEFTAKGNGGHSSTPDKSNPVTRLASFIVDVESHKLFKPVLSPITIETFNKFSLTMKGNMKFVFKHAKSFKRLLAKVLVNFSPDACALVKTTICFTMVKGSDESNTIPTIAHLTGNLRISHSDTKDSVINKLTKIANKYDITISELDPGYHSDVCSYKTEQFKFLTNMINESFEDVIVAPFISTGASDSKYFNELSDNIFRFAPFTVSDEQLASMHALDENIDTATLVKAVDFYKNLIRKL